MKHNSINGVKYFFALMAVFLYPVDVLASPRCLAFIIPETVIHEHCADSGCDTQGYQYNVYHHVLVDKIVNYVFHYFVLIIKYIVPKICLFTCVIVAELLKSIATI